jgi:mitogen-activated protein kinase organizer 1
MEVCLSLDHEGAMTLAYSNNGDYLMSAGKDRAIKLWNSNSGELIKVYQGGHNYEIASLKISSDNTQFISSGTDANVLLWDVSKGKVVTKLQGHQKKVNTICWNYTNHIIVSGSEDTTVKVWDIREKYPIETLSGGSDSIIKVGCNSDQIISGSADGYLQTYDIRCGVIYFDNLKQVMCGMDINRNDELIATTHIDGILRITDKSLAQIIKAFEQTHTRSDYSIPCAFTQDNKVLVGNNIGELTVYDTYNENFKVHKIDNNQIVSIVSHPENKNFLAVATQYTIKLYIKNT